MCSSWTYIIQVLFKKMLQRSFDIFFSITSHFSANVTNVEITGHMYRASLPHKECMEAILLMALPNSKFMYRAQFVFNEHQ